MGQRAAGSWNDWAFIRMPLHISLYQRNLGLTHCQPAKTLASILLQSFALVYSHGHHGPHSTPGSLFTGVCPHLWSWRHEHHQYWKQLRGVLIKSRDTSSQWTWTYILVIHISDLFSVQWTYTLCKRRSIKTSALKRMRQPGFPWQSSGWDSAFQCRERGFDPWSGN